MIFMQPSGSYGPTHEDLDKLGKVVDIIIVGQSIGEPWTQLTSRTFCTCCVFTGGTIDLFVTIESHHILHNVNIPLQKFSFNSEWSVRGASFTDTLLCYLLMWFGFYILYAYIKTLTTVSWWCGKGLNRKL